MRKLTANSIQWIRKLSVLVALSCLATPVLAQPEPGIPGDQSVQPGEEIFQVTAPDSNIKLVHLDTRVIELSNRILVVDGFNADVLSVNALSPNRIRIHAEQPGVTTLKLIDEFDSIFKIEVFVEPDTRELQAYLKRLFPESAIEAIGLREGVVLRGWVTDPTHIPQIIEVAEQFYPTVHPQMNVGGVSQVQLHVKVMEIQRSKMRDLGFNFAILGQDFAIASTVGGIANLASFETPFGGPPSIGINGADSDLTFAVTGSNTVFQGFLKALQTEALAKVLAEPVLVTTSGRPASMLSGGEFPILVPQGVGAVSIDFKEFGIKMEAVPIVLGNGRLRLDIAPEVSDRDVSNSIVVDGISVPGLSVRRVNTQVEMRFGETLMIGGLISTTRIGSTQKIPFLGELPWIGAAFSRKDYRFGETELLILVTPQMVSPMGPHQVPSHGPGQHTDIPTDKELYFDGLLEVPLYGPECPDCGPYPGGLITPGQYQEVTPSDNTPIPALEPETAQRTQSKRFLQLVGAESDGSAARSVDRAEYQFSVEADRSGRIHHAGAESAIHSNSSASQQQPYATLPEGPESHGLIQPKK
ncbi:Type II secretion system protein D precursor [Thalassoglobus neptunius]|uniref:Type II secretion system protein D n=1 Tax=Thalassoglobus neptunius TaxID=1938619 RepID=A0A5C5X3Q7_9PLAN|nr:pilus assembly protein N-terminal domain-containing protein [Thalassoglobus neptunius]TWT57747.1 Type II secretion system protein D precursor [Thalassoglobus neptunius]